MVERQGLALEAIGQGAHAERGHLQRRIAGMGRQHQRHTDRRVAHQRGVSVERHLSFGAQDDLGGGDHGRDGGCRCGRKGRRDRGSGCRWHAQRQVRMRFAQRHHLPPGRARISRDPLPQAEHQQRERIARHPGAPIHEDAARPVTAARRVGQTSGQLRMQCRLEAERPGEGQAASVEERAQTARIEHRDHRLVETVGLLGQRVARRPGIEAGLEILDQIDEGAWSLSALRGLPAAQSARHVCGPPGGGDEPVVRPDRDRDRRAVGTDAIAERNQSRVVGVVVARRPYLPALKTSGIDAIEAALVRDQDATLQPGTVGQRQGRDAVEQRQRGTRPSEHVLLRRARQQQIQARRSAGRRPRCDRREFGDLGVELALRQECAVQRRGQPPQGRHPANQRAGQTQHRRSGIRSAAHLVSVLR